MDLTKYDLEQTQEILRHIPEAFVRQALTEIETEIELKEYKVKLQFTDWKGEDDWMRLYVVSRGPRIIQSIEEYCISLDESCDIWADTMSQRIHGIEKVEISVYPNELNFKIDKIEETNWEHFKKEDYQK